jgi:ceramide glucosyltransferase
MVLLIWLGGLFSVLAVVGALYDGAAAVFVRRYMVRTKPPTHPELVTLLKPLHGAEVGLLENLESFCDQAWEAPVQIVFGVQDPSDPAIAVVEDLKARWPDADIALVVDTTPQGQNGKVANLINMAGVARHPVLVISDSDIRVGSDYLDEVVGALQGQNIGIVSCLYVGRSGTGVWAELSAMAVSYQFLRNVVFALSLNLAKPCMGSTIALRQADLEAVGGLQAFADLLADDYELGRAVRRLGRKLMIPATTVVHMCQERSFGELFSHELRWSRTIRLIDPGGHAGSVVTHSIPLALAGCLLTGFAPAAIAALALALIGRCFLKLSVDRLANGEAGPWGLLPLRDILSFAVFLGSFFGTSVSWRGKRLRLGADGALSPV